MNIVQQENIPKTPIDSVEGLSLPSGVFIRKMLKGEYGLLIEVHVPKGMVTPSHIHEHDSFLYVVKGSVRATVGTETGLASAGDAILHPAGVEHISEALEDCIWIEVKAPAEETW